MVQIVSTEAAAGVRFVYLITEAVKLPFTHLRNDEPITKGLDAKGRLVTTS